MVKFLTDKHIPPDRNEGLITPLPDLTVVRVHDVGPRTADDETILEWATANRYVLVSFDRRTLPRFVNARVAAAQPMPGPVVVDDRLPLGQAVERLVLAAFCSNEGEFKSRVGFIPPRPSG